MPAAASYFASLADSRKYAYHVTRRSNLSIIFDGGVLPWNQSGNAKFSGTMQARPNHTYWALDSYNLLMEDLPHDAELGTVAEDFIVLRVPLSAFAPAQVNPDEDALVYDVIDEAGLKALGLASFGQWADSINLGADETQTADLIEGHESFAYRGSISPEHITVCEFERVERSYGSTLVQCWTIQTA